MNCSWSPSTAAASVTVTVALPVSGYHIPTRLPRLHCKMVMFSESYWDAQIVRTWLVRHHIPRRQAPLRMDQLGNHSPSAGRRDA